MTILFHIATDHVLLFDSAGNKDVVLFNDLERNLAPRFLHFVKGKDVSTILVINGPGSFTLMRVATICINIYISLEKNHIELISIAKFELYRWMMEQEMIPAIGIVFIGQRKKLSILESKNNSKDDNHLRLLDEASMPEKYRVDYSIEHPMMQYLDKNSIITWEGVDEDSIKVKAQGVDYEVPVMILGESVDQIQAKYLHEPV